MSLFAFRNAGVITLMIVSKSSFVGGINQLADITKLGQDEYWLMLNGRVRANVVESVRLPLDITGNLPVGANLQDITGAGELLLCFANGQAYYQTPGGTWQLLTSFLMGSTEDRVYTETVPGSTVNYRRTASSGPSGAVVLQTALAASQAALIVCDGVNRPWVIYPDGTSRVLGDYASWTVANPEYVPIANKPMFHNGVLYMIGKDQRGVENQIFRSVTGQPFNFVIPVTSTGDKTSPSEREGGAPAMAHNISYEALTALFRGNSSEGSFVASTTKRTALVYPDVANLIYAEPQFRNQEIASIGALNQDSIVDILGDVAVVHDVGIRSFNGILQFRYEGRNSPLSAPINSLLDGITQTAAATGTHDNYVLFAVQTVYGNGILIYDTLRQVFVSLDIYPSIGQIRKFTSVLYNGKRYTYFMTDTKVYQFDSSPERATTTVYGNELIAPDDYDTVQAQGLRLSFNGVTEGGYAEAILYVDGQFANWQTTRILARAQTGNGTQLSIPFDTPLTEASLAQANFNFVNNSPIGFRAGFLIRFNCDGALVNAAAEVVVGRLASLATGSGTSTAPEQFIIVGDDGVGPSGFTPEEYAERVALQAQMQKQKNITLYIGTGDHAYNSGTTAEVAANLAPFWGNVKKRCAFVPGNHDNDTSQGEPFFTYFVKPRYNSVETDNVEVFLVNTGFDSAMNQTEADNAGTLVNSVQFQWLRGALAASTKKHKWVVWHHPPVGSGADYYPGVSQMQAIPLKEWGATALFCGHMHIVERLNWNGLLVLISGAGGRDFRPLHDPPSPYSVWGQGDVAAYWHAEASALGVLFTCRDKNGAILDKYFQVV